MSDPSHAENRDRVLELLDAIKSARTPAKVRELGKELVAVIAADRAGVKADEGRSGSTS